MSGCKLIMLDNFRGMDLISWFPCVVTFGVSLPFDEILKLFRSSELLVCDDSFDFVFFFSINVVRGSWDCAQLFHDTELGGMHEICCEFSNLGVIQVGKLPEISPG